MLHIRVHCDTHTTVHGMQADAAAEGILRVNEET